MITEVEEIETALDKTFQFEIRVMLRTYEEILKLSEGIPKDWVNDKDHKTDIIFLWDEFDREDTLKLLKTNPSVDHLKYFPGAIVWHLDRAHFHRHSSLQKYDCTECEYRQKTRRTDEQRLTFTELWCTTRSSETKLLTFFDTAITGEEAFWF